MRHPKTGAEEREILFFEMIFECYETAKVPVRSQTKK